MFRLKIFYQRWLAPIAVLVLVIWGVMLCVHPDRNPPIGTYIAVAGVGAAAVTIWPPESNWGKAVWVALFIALAIFEIHNLYTDRDSHDKREREAMEKEADAFRAIAKGIDKSIESGQRQFETTVRKLNTAQTGINQNLDALLGSGSYPCVVPRVHGIPIGAPVELDIVNYGHNPLTGVEVMVLSMQEFLGQHDRPKIPMELGTVTPSWPRTAGAPIFPNPAGDIAGGISLYIIQIWTQNGFYSEALSFRKSRGGGNPWAYQFNMTQTDVIKQAAEMKRKGFARVHYIPSCQQKWSDEIFANSPAK